MSDDPTAGTGAGTTGGDEKLMRMETVTEPAPASAAAASTASVTVKVDPPAATGAAAAASPAAANPLLAQLNTLPVPNSGRGTGRGGGAAGASGDDALDRSDSFSVLKSLPSLPVGKTDFDHLKPSEQNDDDLEGAIARNRFETGEAKTARSTNSNGSAGGDAIAATPKAAAAAAAASTPAVVSAAVAGATTATTIAGAEVTIAVAAVASGTHARTESKGAVPLPLPSSTTASATAASVTAAPALVPAKSDPTPATRTSAPVVPPLSATTGSINPLLKPTTHTPIGQPQQQPISQPAPHPIGKPVPIAATRHSSTEQKSATVSATAPPPVIVTIGTRPHVPPPLPAGGVAYAPTLHTGVGVERDDAAAEQAEHAHVEREERDGGAGTGPSIAKAKRYRDLTLPRWRHDDGYHEYHICQFPDSEFVKFGLGTYLYFKLVRRLKWIFLLMALLMIPALYFYVQAGGIKTNLLLDQTTIGNMGYANDTIFLAQTGGAIDSVSYAGDASREQIGIMASVLDVIAMLIFLLFIVTNVFTSEREAARYNDEFLTICHFTVAVSNLPPDATRESLKQFFESIEFGPVVDVAIAFNDHDLMELYKKRGRLRKRLDAARQLQVAAAASPTSPKAHADATTSAVNDYLKQISKVDRDIVYELSHFIRVPVTSYVTFENQETAIAAMKKFNRLNSCWTCCCYDQKYLYNGYKPIVGPAPEPSNILFHNLKYTKCDKRVRRCGTFLFTILCLCITTVAVFIASAYQNTLSSSIRNDCGSTHVTLEAVHNATGSTGYDSILKCYCSELPPSELANETTFCSSYIAQYAIAKALVVATAFGVLLVDWTLRRLIRKISNYELHTSRTSQSRAAASKLFISLFINSALIVLLIHSNVDRYFSGFVFFSGEYSDFTPEWYSGVGVTIMLTMILNIFNPHGLELFKIWWNSRKRGEYDADNPPPVKMTQEELNHIWSGNNFELSERYATILNNIFVTLFYSSGMPLMIFNASVIFWVTYWFDKISFLRLYKRPPRYDDSLSQYGLSMLPWAIVLHCVIGIWCFTAPTTLSYHTSSISGPRTEGDLFAFRTFLNSANSIPLVLLLIFMVFILVFRSTLGQILCGCCCNRHACHCLDAISCCGTKVQPKKITYSAAKQKMLLESYHLCRQAEYRDAYLITPSKKQIELPHDLNKKHHHHSSHPHGGTTTVHVHQMQHPTFNTGAPKPVAGGAAGLGLVAAASTGGSGRISTTATATATRLNGQSSMEMSPLPENTKPGTTPIAGSAAGGAGGGVAQVGSPSAALYVVTSGSTDLSPAATAAGGGGLTIGGLTPHGARLSEFNRLDPGQAVAAPATMTARGTRERASLIAAGTKLSIPCSHCAQFFTIIDHGKVGKYTCPFCSTQVEA